jgi:hypothetical protein
VQARQRLKGELAWARGIASDAEKLPAGDQARGTITGIVSSVESLATQRSGGDQRTVMGALRRQTRELEARYGSLLPKRVSRRLREALQRLGGA